MKIPRDVSGRHLADTLCGRWQYVKVHQAGSHIILETSDPAQQRIAIPDHKALRVGTFSSILRSVAKHKGLPRDTGAIRSSAALGWPLDPNVRPSGSDVNPNGWPKWLARRLALPQAS